MVEEIRRQEWWLIRHAPVHLSYIYGQRDVEADYSGDEEFKNLAARLPSKGLIISSDLQRCRMTAQKIARKQNRPDQTIFSNAAFREQHFGDWQGLTYSQAEQADKPAYGQFWNDPVFQSPPNGESFSGMVTRVMDARREITSNHTEDVVLLFAHAGTIRAFLSEALDIPLARALSLVIDPLSHTKLTVFKTETHESWQVDWINRIGVN